MIPLAPGVGYFDLMFQNTPRVIATAVLAGPGGVAIVDPGPSSTLPALREGLDRAGMKLGDVTALVLTHIHLDHAGACGTLLREKADLRIYVHERGAPHLADPAKLIASATRLYGEAMDRLWGEVQPVPQSAIAALRGGERIEVGGRALEVEYTPGHASHHVSYFNRDADVAFVGDTAGVQIVGGGDVLPPTPPPDVDLERWQDSLQKIERWRPDTLFLTHFGPSGPLGEHFTALRDNIEGMSRLVRDSLAREGTDEDREAWFAAECHRRLRGRMSDTDARVYEAAGRFDLNWRGLARYWRKKG
jgi:glyoxylase-like metal-dependent hydrolase (beta-lactamase superfamily II)